MILKNKNGFAGLDMVQWLIRLLFLTIVVFACVFLINLYIKNDINIAGVEMDLFYKRLIYSPNGIMYKDETLNRAYPGIIDLEKFKDGKNITDSIINYGDSNNYVAAKVSLYYFNPEDTYSEFYYNEFGYKKWKPLLGIEGKGGVRSQTKELPVLVYDNNKYEQMILRVEIVTPYT